MASVCIITSHIYWAMKCNKPIENQCEPSNQCRKGNSPKRTTHLVLQPCSNGQMLQLGGLKVDLNGRRIRIFSELEEKTVRNRQKVPEMSNWGLRSGCTERIMWWSEASFRWGGDWGQWHLQVRLVALQRKWVAPTSRHTAALQVDWG